MEPVTLTTLTNQITLNELLVVYTIAGWTVAWLALLGSLEVQPRPLKQRQPRLLKQRMLQWGALTLLMAAWPIFLTLPDFLRTVWKGLLAGRSDC